MNDTSRIIRPLHTHTLERGGRDGGVCRSERRETLCARKIAQKIKSETENEKANYLFRGRGWEGGREEEREWGDRRVRSVALHVFPTLLVYVRFSEVNR